MPRNGHNPYRRHSESVDQLPQQRLERGGCRLRRHCLQTGAARGGSVNRDE